MEKLAVLLSVIVNVILFFVLTFRKHSDGVSVAYEGKKAAESSRKPNWMAIREQLSACIPTGKNIIRYSKKRVSKYGANYTTFAAFLCLNYILPYFMWTDGEAYRCNTLTIIRFLGVVMCIPLLLKNYWPTRALKYFPTYWHTAVMYVLPFSTTLSFLIVGGTTSWLINIALAIMMLSAVVDWLSGIILAVLGVGLGAALYHVCFSVLGDMTSFNMDPVTMHQLTYTCIFSTSIGLLFLERREKEEDKRMETLELFGRVVSAEMRNILARSKAYASSIQFLEKQMHVDKVLPTEEGRELLLIKMDKRAHLTLKETMDGLMHHSERGIRDINRMLATLCTDINTDDFTILSMQMCVTDALTLCGLNSHQKSSLLINLEEDFLVYGSAYYMQHILFNLVENVYKHSQKDCIVEIWLANNKLHVKDNGVGIAKEALPYIFDTFFTTAQAAMGIGLSFCKLVMEAFGGIIICKSRQGKKSFTEFVLTFPEIKDTAQ
jgi:signal transduction histidine kinase